MKYFLQRIYEIINKTFVKLIVYYESFSHSWIDEKKYLIEQESFFKNMNLSRSEGISKISELDLNLHEKNYPMFSEHIFLFSSISIKKKINKILEIGTFDGINSFLMAKIFPEAEITTIDLDEKNNLFNKLYNRDSKNIEVFLQNRNNYLALDHRIKFIKKNSISYIYDNPKEQYDLIWVDGHHGYPYVAIDFINALRIIKKDGLIICDDVLKSKYLDPYNPYNSNASYYTLEALKKNGFIHYDLVYKRLKKKFNNSEFHRKYLAIVRRKFND